MLLESLLQQNYISYQNNTYQPKKGASMGSPISNTVAEIFLEYLENTHLKHILESKQIIFYTRYINDVLMIYNTKYTTPETIHQHINIKTPQPAVHNATRKQQQLMLSRPPTNPATR
jgi:hypothetical protein